MSDQSVEDDENEWNYDEEEEDEDGAYADSDQEDETLDDDLEEEEENALQPQDEEPEGVDLPHEEEEDDDDEDDDDDDDASDIFESEVDEDDDDISGDFHLHRSPARLFLDGDRSVACYRKFWLSCFSKDRFDLRRYNAARQCHGMLDVLCHEILPAKKTENKLRVCHAYFNQSMPFADQADKKEYFSGLEQLGQALSTIESLEELDFRTFTLRTMHEPLEGAACLVRHVRQITRLTCQTRSSMKDIADAITGHSCLEQVVLQNVTDSPDPCFLKALLTLPKLKDLSVSDPLLVRTLSFFPEGFLRDLFALPSIRKVSLDRLNMEREATNLCHALGKKSTKLQSLELKVCNVPASFPENLCQSLQRNQSLKALFLEPQNEAMLGSLGRKLGSVLGSLPELQSFGLSLSELDDDETLETVNQQVSDCLSALATSDALENLVLADCLWNASLCRALRRILKQGLSVLTIKCEVGTKRNEAWHSVASCLKTSKRLQKLALSFGIEDDHYDSDEELSGEEILQAMTQLLISSDAPLPLEYLTLECYIANISTSAIATFLSSTRLHSSLKSIRLAFNSVDPAGWEKLVEVLQETFSLCHFSVGWNEEPLAVIPSTPHRDLANGMLAMNRAGRCYFFNDAQDKVQGICVLSAAHSNLDCLFLHVRENPFLCRLNQELPAESAAAPKSCGAKRKRPA